jgi:hypothetical protein
MEKKFEIFVSSTYLDLQEERQFVRDFITHLGHIPTGMEEFVGGRPSWEHIEEAIRSCDYYVLIVGGRYGSPNPDSPDGYSFTECEYRLAGDLNKPCLFFVMPARVTLNLAKAKRETAREAKRNLERFRNLVTGDNVIFWNNKADLENRMQRDLPRWLNRNPLESGGWVRTREYANVKAELVKAESRKFVLSYLFDRLNPYDNIHLTVQFLRDAENLLEDRLDSMSRLLRVLEKIINIYVNRLIEAQIRVYFAYRLNPQNSAAGESDKEPLYRLGISNSKEGNWQRGKIVKGFSNIHNVYQKCQILGHRDSTQKIRQTANLNIPVKDEGSVIAAPIFGTLGKSAVGVVGLNSPNTGEAFEHYELVKELSVIFSSLFYAYGRQLEDGKSDGKTDDGISSQIRDEIADHFDRELGEPSDLID